MNILYDASGDTYTILRVSAPVGHALSYEMRPEFNGAPDSIVHYHSGRLHRFCPDAIQCNPHGAGLPIDPLTKPGTYNFIVAEEAEWDCISPMAAHPHRVVAETLLESGQIGGDVYLSSGEWAIGGQVYQAPLLLIDLPEFTAANVLSGDPVLFHHIHTVPLEA